MVKYELDKSQRDVVLAFLDRVSLKGLKEVEAMNNVLTALAPKEKEE